MTALEAFLAGLPDTDGQAQACSKAAPLAPTPQWDFSGFFEDSWRATRN